VRSAVSTTDVKKTVRRSSRRKRAAGTSARGNLAIHVFNGTQRYNASGIGRRVVVRARCRARGSRRPQPAKQYCRPLEGR
jgi:hypothetical protein